MTKTLIIEDEAIAAQNLKRLLSEEAPDIEVIDTLQSIEESVAWFKNHKEPDLVFLDIHLADGLSFAIFDEITLKCPIIFTTAYDQYALQAFKVNSIDYLLKPIVKEDLVRAISKYNSLTINPAEQNEKIENLICAMTQSHNYKSYFLIPIADKLQPLAVADIAFFFLENKLTVAYTFDGKTYTFDKPLDAIMTQLNPEQFFRANRQFIVAHKAISDISFWIGNKLSLSLKVTPPERVIISKARVSEFKNWYTAG